jgi:hypothetical protein
MAADLSAALEKLARRADRNSLCEKSITCLYRLGVVMGEKPSVAELVNPS